MELNRAAVLQRAGHLIFEIAVIGVYQAERTFGKEWGKGYTIMIWLLELTWSCCSDVE